MAAHDLINAAVKANESAMRTAIKNGYPVQLPANQYLPKAMNGNIDVIHLGQFADLDAGFDEYRKQQAQAASQDFSDLDAGFAEWSAAQGVPNVESMQIGRVNSPNTASTSGGGQSTGSRSGRASMGARTASAEIPQLDNMAVPVIAKTTTKTTTKAEKTAAKEVKQANSTLSKADKALQTAQKKQTVAENNLRKKLDRAEAEAQKADAMRGAAKVTKKGNTTVIEPAQNVQQTKRKMQNLAKEEARAQADYAKAQANVQKAEIQAQKAADRQAATNDRARAVKAAESRRAAQNLVQNQAADRNFASYDPMAGISANASGEIQQLVPTDDVRTQIARRQSEAIRALASDPKQAREEEKRQAEVMANPEAGLVRSAVRSDALRPQQSTSRLGYLSDPNRRLTKEEQAEAEQIIRDYNRAHGIHGGIEGWYDGPNDPQSPEYQEYAAVQRLKAKTTGGAIGSGISDAYNVINGLLPEGAAKLADFVTGDPNNSFSQSIRQANDLRDQTMQASQTQAPLAYAGGNMAGKMSQYAATNGLFDSIATGQLGLEAGSEAAFWANQLAQNAQDWALNEIPDYIQNRQNGISREEALRNFGREALIDAGGNVTMGALGDYVIPSLINRFGRGAAESAGDAARAVSDTPAPVDDSVDAALFGTGMMQDLSGADIPALKEADDYILGGVGRQADDVADAVKTADVVENVADTAKAADAAPEASNNFDLYELAHKKLRSQQERQWLVDNNSYGDQMALADLNHEMSKRGYAIFDELLDGDAAAATFNDKMHQFVSDAVHEQIARGEISPEAYAEAFDRAYKQSHETGVPLKQSDVIAWAYQLDGKEVPESLRRQYYRTVDEKLADAKSDLDHWRSIKKYEKAKYGEVSENVLQAEKRAKDRIAAIKRGEVTADEIPQMRSIAEDVGIPEQTDEVLNVGTDEIPSMEEVDNIAARRAELQARADGIDDVGGTFYDRHTGEVVPQEVVEQLDAELREANRQFDEAVANAPEPKDIGGVRPQTVDDSDELPFLDDSSTEPPENWQALFDEPAPARSMEEAVDEIPSVQSIAEDTGIPNQTDEVLNIGADEIPSATRQAEPIPAMSAEEAVDNGIPLLEDTAEEVTDVARANGNGGNIGNGTPQIEGPVGRTKTSKTYTNTGKRGRGWNETEYKTYTDARNYQYESISEKQSVEDAIQMTIDEGPENLRKRLLNTPDTERLSSQEIDALMMQWRIQVANARAAEAAGEDATEMWKESNRIFKKIQTEETKNAQAVQVLAKWSRHTPEGMLSEADRIINGRTGGTDEATSAMEKIYKKFFKGKGDIELSPEFQKEFLDLAEQLQDATGREREEIMAQLGKLINKQIPAKVPEKIKTYLMDSMLGNFRTLITRNAGGNVGFNAVEQTAERPLAALIDSIIGKKTGRRTQAGLSKAAFADYLSGFKKGLADEWADFKTIKGKAGSSIHTARSGESTLEEAIANNRQVFSTFLFDKADQLVKHGLSVGDRPFYEAVYKETLGDYTRMYKAGKMGKDIQSLTEEEFKQYAEAAAKMNALAACYQDDSALAKGFMELRNGVAGLSKGLTGVDILSQFAMPFVKTPANIINRAVEYSPLGIVKNAVNTAKDLKANAAIAEAAAKRGEDVAKGIAGLSPAQQNRLANETARNILGTGLFVGGVEAARQGIISGGFSKDKDEAAIQRSNGMQEYALHKDDAYRSIDWIPVLGNDLVAAAAFYEAMKNSEGTLPEQLEAGLAAGLESQFDTSMLQGLENLFSSNEYSRNQGIKGIVPNVVSTIKSGATQAIPSLVRQAAAFGDDYKRQLGGDDPNDYYFNSVKNAIPGIRESLEPKVDNQGELVEQNAGRNAFQKFFDNFLSPWTTTYEKHTPLDEEAKRLSDSTGSDIAFATTPQRSDITTEDFTPSDKDFTDYRIKVGAMKKEIGEGLIQSDFYQQFSDADKAVALQEVYSAAKAVARKPYVKIDPTTRYPQVYERSGLEGVLSYINANVNSKKLNFKKDGTPVGLSQASTRGKFDALAATGYDEETQGRIYYDSLDADDRENLKGLYKDAGDVGMYQFMRGKVLGDADANSSMSIQEVMDYGTTYPEVSDEVISKLMPKHSGTFKREGDVWNYYDKNGKLTKSGSAQQYDYEAPEIDYSITRGPVQEAEEETAVEEPAAEPIQQTESNAEINPATGRPVAPTRQTTQTAQAEPAVEIDPRTGRPKAPTRQGEIPKLEPNGNATWNNDWEIEGSKSWQRFHAIDPSYTTQDYARVYNAMDKDRSGKVKKDEIVAYLDQQSMDDAYKAALYDAFARAGSDNPYKKKKSN